MLCWIQENAVDLIGHLLTLIGIIVGALIVVFQLSRQHRSSLALQKDNAKEVLKLDIYKTLDERIRQLSDAITSASMYVFMIPAQIETYQEQISNKFPSQPLTKRALEFLRLHEKAGEATVRIIEEFEAWLISLPELELFQTAINSANYDAREAIQPLFSALVRVLPIDPPEDAPQNVPRPITKPLLDRKQLQELRTLVDNYKNAMDDIGCYIFDLRVEAQNNLLSGLFEHRVPPRKPLDKKFKVLSTKPEKLEELMTYFKEQTAWGKNKIRLDAEFEESNGKK
ncbi:MAG: hypothetical protein KKB30_15900 [Proteobacteria bacterium]|nr:hypothetical protein [Pseudomonadota bacterium]MBU1717200.1 hypothetical protein [Pseudomonadota bacterium]